MASDLTLAATQQIERTIHVIRSQNVMLDADLAALYGVQTRVLLQSVRRHLDRFPDDFMFQLTKDQYDGLRSQIVTSNRRGGRRYRPFAFTEQGVAMLSSILNSPRAIQVNIEIMRTFVRLRQASRDQRRARTAPERSGAEVRRPVRHRLRRHPTIDGATRSTPPPTRLPNRGAEREPVVGAPVPHRASNRARHRADAARPPPLTPRPHPVTPPLAHPSITSIPGPDLSGSAAVPAAPVAVSSPAAILTAAPALAGPWRPSLPRASASRTPATPAVTRPIPLTPVRRGTAPNAPYTP